MACFNINEPLIYGFPLMLNAAMIIPFIVMPLVSLILGYAAIMLGLMPAPVGLVGVLPVCQSFSAASSRVPGKSVCSRSSLL